MLAHIDLALTKGDKAGIARDVRSYLSFRAPTGGQARREDANIILSSAVRLMITFSLGRTTPFHSNRAGVAGAMARRDGIFGLPAPYSLAQAIQSHYQYRRGDFSSSGVRIIK